MSASASTNIASQPESSSVEGTSRSPSRAASLRPTAVRAGEDDVIDVGLRQLRPGLARRGELLEEIAREAGFEEQRVRAGRPFAARLRSASTAPRCPRPAPAPICTAFRKIG